MSLLMPIFGFIIIALTVILTIINIKEKSRKKWFSFGILFLIFGFTATNIILSHIEIDRLNIQLIIEQKRSKPPSLNIYGMEIQGSKTSHHMTILHEVAFRVDSIRQTLFDSLYDKADTLCDKLIVDYPYFGGIYFWKGTLAFIKGNEAECESLWLQAFELEPKNTEYSILYRNLGILKIKFKNYDSAIEILKVALSISVPLQDFAKAKKEKGEYPANKISVDECLF